MRLRLRFDAALRPPTPRRPPRSERRRLERSSGGRFLLAHGRERFASCSAGFVYPCAVNSCRLAIKELGPGTASSRPRRNDVDRDGLQSLSPASGHAPAKRRPLRDQVLTAAMSDRARQFAYAARRIPRATIRERRPRPRDRHRVPPTFDLPATRNGMISRSIEPRRSVRSASRTVCSLAFNCAVCSPERRSSMFLVRRFDRYAERVVLPLQSVNLCPKPSGVGEWRQRS